MKRLLFLLILIPVFVFGQSSSFIDNRDGKTYRTVKIGKQIWMAENLSFESKSGNYWSYTFKNGDVNIEKFGYLYDWVTAKKVCPTGWYLPSDDDWTILSNYLGDNAGLKMKSNTGWAFGRGNGTNESGFNAFPGGMRFKDGEFYTGNSYGNWWSSSEEDSDYALIRKLYFSRDFLYRTYDYKQNGYSVRCIKDKTP